MSTRLAAVLALIAFATCLLVGAFQAGNTFATSVGRAVVAMFGTFIIGLLLGAMGSRMLAENVKDEEGKIRNSQTKDPASDR